MSGSPDYILDIAGLSASKEPRQRVEVSGALRGRPWLAVHWRCCHVYSRIYRNGEATAYVGGCPSCGKAVRARIGPGGLNGRFFEAY